VNPGVLILAALKANRIALIEMPEPTDQGEFEDGEGAGWVSFPEGVSATVPSGSVFDQDAELAAGDARNLAAALLAAAEVVDL
ncbi:hypothetical protein, partial [Klebsiella pneumoniae]|uniref:hypothetical protein n=1 Tax=Klebsiella pneumoniae TaxID=573 RepID=UPI00191C22F6